MRRLSSPPSVRWAAGSTDRANGEPWISTPNGSGARGADGRCPKNERNRGRSTRSVACSLIARSPTLDGSRWAGAEGPARRRCRRSERPRAKGVRRGATVPLNDRQSKATSLYPSGQSFQNVPKTRPCVTSRTWSIVGSWQKTPEAGAAPATRSWNLRSPPAFERRRARGYSPAAAGAAAFSRRLAATATKKIEIS